MPSGSFNGTIEYQFPYKDKVSCISKVLKLKISLNADDYKALIDCSYLYTNTKQWACKLVENR